ncbi:MAG: beta-propeller fold lactonase family protein [Planctomycetota bacterium]
MHPIGLTPDGLRLLSVIAPDARLCVWSLADPDAPALLGEIPVGLEPVSVTARTDDEAWVVNWLSDSISVVSLAERAVIDVLPVGDEPADVAFAGGKAFVTAAAADEVHVFDAETREPLGVLPIDGKDPRALAVSPDGATVYALIRLSGNRTTIVPKAQAPTQPDPTNPALPAPPKVGRVVSQDDPEWSGLFQYSLDDHDVAAIDVETLSVTGYVRGAGTVLHDLAIHPGTGELFVVGTEARNVVRFEPELRGHAIDSLLARTAGEPGAEPAVFDLNPTIDYAVLPNEAGRSVALAEPTGVAIDAAAGVVYVAAHGTDRVGVLSTDGVLVDRIEVGSTPGAIVDTMAKRGPRGLALHPGMQRLYVLNRLSQTIAVVDTTSRQVLAELRNGTHDPTPAEIRDGRRFLYDAKLAGNGTFSCAACHVDSELDVLVWDLGDPGGELAELPHHPDPKVDSQLQTQVLHPMKGPMVTQTLRGLSGIGPLHWRGDKPAFDDFNGAFDKLMGGAELSHADMELFSAYGTTIAFPPNPSIPLDGEYATEPAHANQAAGEQVFLTNEQPSELSDLNVCVECHALPNGTDGTVIPTSGGPVRNPPLRNLYRRQGFNASPEGSHKAGVGYNKDGHVPSLAEFVALDFFAVPDDLEDDLVAFLLAFDTGTPPATGHEVLFAEAGPPDPALLAEVAVLEQLAADGSIDLVARLWVAGEARGLLFDPHQAEYLPDGVADKPLGRDTLVALAASGAARVRFLGVPAGSGPRVGIDRDLDGVLDADEGVAPYGDPTLGCSGAPGLAAGSEPSVGNELFTLVGSAAPGASGYLLVGGTPADLPLFGVQLFVLPAFIEPIAADAHGVAAVALPLDAALTPGSTAFAQLVWADACGPAGFSSSAGLAVTLQP